MPATVEQLVEQFQCPGCVYGSDTKCGKYRDDQGCQSHMLGTIIPPIGLIALGLPKGFCRAGVDEMDGAPRPRVKMPIRVWPEGTNPAWDHLNIAVWAMVEDGFLFVRTFAPRVNHTWVDVIEGGTLALVPNAVNVGEFIDGID